MSIEANKAVVRRYFDEVWNQWHPDALGEVVAAEVVLHSHARPPMMGIDRWKQAMLGFHAAFPDVTFAIEEMVAEGERVVTRGTVRGTHRGPLMGIAPTGASVTFPGVWVLRLADGKIAEEWEVMDLLGLLQQLGATVAPPVPATG